MSPAPEKLAIVGGGAWGTALARVLGPRFSEIQLWVFEDGLAGQIQRDRTNEAFLPGIILPSNITASNSLAQVLEGARTVISVMPSHVVREVYTQMTPHLDRRARLVSATKGLETGSLMRISQVIRDVTLGRFPVSVLSGPTFAREVAEGKPTAVVAASEDLETAVEIQAMFSGPTFRVYSSDDPVGVEIGGALKNVIAIGAGICDGLGLGHNAVAALITRGLAEMTRLAVEAGGKPKTLAGLAGLGDLVLTCTGELSRNRRVGQQLAKGIRLRDILSSTTSVAEGVTTTTVGLELAERNAIDMPITNEMNAVLNLGRSPAEAIHSLMTRTLRNER